MPRRGGHWSRPAARRTLDALMLLGGSATSYQLMLVTHSVCVHSEIYALRCWLQFDHGYDEADTHDAVRREDLGLNEGGRQVVRYTVRDDVRRLHRRLREDARALPVAGPRDERRPTQAALFNNWAPWRQR